jgi:hypothetical protein
MFFQLLPYADVVTGTQRLAPVALTNRREAGPVPAALMKMEPRGATVVGAAPPVTEPYRIEGPVDVPTVNPAEATVRFPLVTSEPETVAVAEATIGSAVLIPPA